MANQPRPDNPNRNIRMEDELWDALGTFADEDGVKRSLIVRTACEQYRRRREAAARRRKA